jgi:hypothetical protein
MVYLDLLEVEFSINLESNGVGVTNSPHSIINFTGVNVSTTDQGGGRAEVNINVLDDVANTQARMDSSLALTTSYTNIAFNLTDVENNTLVIKHDDTNKDRINVYQDGFYFVKADFTGTNNTGVNIVAVRVIKNDTDVISGSESSLNLYSGEIQTISTNNVIQLQANDYLSVQTYGVDTGTIWTGKFIVYKLDGIKGEKGDTGAPGSGSNMVIQNEGVDVLNTPHSIINFKGSLVNAVDTGTGTVDVTITPPAVDVIFGSQFARSESLNVSTVVGNVNWQNKVTLTTTDLPSGTYRIGIAYGWNHDGATNDFEARFRLNGTDMGEIHLQEPQDTAGTFGSTGTNQRMYVNRVFYQTISGVNIITLDYRTNSSVDESSIWDAVIEMWRVY